MPFSFNSAGKTDATLRETMASLPIDMLFALHSTNMLMNEAMRKSGSKMSESNHQPNPPEALRNFLEPKVGYSLRLYESHLSHKM